MSVRCPYDVPWYVRGMSSASGHTVTHTKRPPLYDIPISARYPYDICTISVRYPYDIRTISEAYIRRTSVRRLYGIRTAPLRYLAVHPPYIRLMGCADPFPLLNLYTEAPSRMGRRQLDARVSTGVLFGAKGARKAEEQSFKWPSARLPCLEVLAT